MESAARKDAAATGASPAVSSAGTGPTRWLNEEEQAAWQAFASVLLRLPGALDRQLERDAGISHFEYVVLSALSEAPDRTLRMGSLAVLASSGLPRLSQVVSRLQKRGWITRAPDPRDGRSTLATLTDEGWEKVVATAPGHVEEVRSLAFDPLTRAQQRQMGEIGRRIMAAVDPGDRSLR
ncbi:MarR family transcriptional regulator [Arthrobacter sp. zg-Y40]|uniref:MarR family winged helix-turn-helix transcriptional regulator n=1 Tax=Arthrobacter sp. zg-Y40 TaxID=2886939 RepID=UPI001D13690A|nr:MarR family transcriptional regulator [Arthrobacter sp. zg-Y40]MCC3279411.1 MarR family transcriptional regulator [Arthrobacter sp. zg-Y40]